MPSLCGVCKAPLISSMQIARSKQEKIDKLVVKEFPSIVPPEPLFQTSNSKSQKQSNRMDLEVTPKSTAKEKITFPADPKHTCAGCDQEIIRAPNANPADDYYAECKDCGSYFCNDCDLLIVDSLRFCPICQE